MDIVLEKSKLKTKQAIWISGSKSETNRLLLLQALYPGLIIENSSNSDDSFVMKKCLESTSVLKNVHHAGTAMRFLASYYALQRNHEIILTGSDRMKERPIRVLVEALRRLGAEICYLEKEGFPPIRIKGKQLINSKVCVTANVSSQYISSLMLIGSSLFNGLEIYLQGTITSVPYIKMTLQILQSLGIDALFENNVIKIHFQKQLKTNHFVIESDWSSASYFYSFIALSEIDTEITLHSFKKDSLQGDARLIDIYKDFGVETLFFNNYIILKKIKHPSKDYLEYYLNDAPDLAQTVIVTCLGLNLTCKLTGLHTLKIKETDRLKALQNELRKFGAEVFIDDETIHLKNSVTFHIENISIDTYQDHRMAMSFAPLALKQSFKIKQADVVSKSYPNFWKDISLIGVNVLSF